jgi:hypothetical protein
MFHVLFKTTDAHVLGTLTAIGWTRSPSDEFADGDDADRKFMNP